MNQANKTALITGASSGIGAATARRLARAGMEVVLTARRADRLEALAAEIVAAGGRARAVPADLTAAEDRQRLLEETGETVDILVNNAGFGWYGYATEMEWTAAAQMLEVNVAALVHLTLLFLPGMRARGRGHIVNVGSVAGSLPSQGAAVYSASKAFLDSFTIALDRELQGSGVRIGIVRPGPVATEFFDAAAARSEGRRIPSEEIAVTPEAVAEAIWSLIRRPRRIAYVPWWMGVIPGVAFYFGWAFDLLGPALLQREQMAARRRAASRT